MTDWMPIESAPKEGSFLVWLQHVDASLGTRVGIMHKHKNGSVINSEFAFDVPTPSHWRPLPGPPEDLS